MERWKIVALIAVVVAGVAGGIVWASRALDAATKRAADDMFSWCGYDW